MGEKISFDAIKLLVDVAEDAYMIADGNGVVLYHNPAYLRAVNDCMESMVGRNLREYIQKGDIKKSSVLMAIDQKKKVSMLTVIRNKQIAYVTSTPVFRADGSIRLILTHARDNTELSNLKEQIRQLEEHARKKEMESLSTSDYGADVVVISAAMRRVFELAGKVNNVGSTVMLLGESGVGKDVVAQYIHQSGVYKNKPYIAINCNALPENLLETELFGYTGGSFTGASREGKKGLFEAAHDGVLFLDEIGDISPNLQVKLLRAIETKKITRVGDYKPIGVNTRIITATNRNLKEMVKKGTFREDLYYRLNVVTIPIPPLRERRDDIRPIALYYLNRYNGVYNMAKKLDKDVMTAFELYQWPGNIRELKNTVERLVITSEDELITLADLSFMNIWGEEYGQHLPDIDNDAISMAINKLIPLEQAVEYVEQKLLLKAKKELHSSRKIAKELKVSRATISRKLLKYNIVDED